MKKTVFFVIASIFLFSSTVEAQRCGCRGCRRYMAPSIADYDANPYGYIDNINYPEPYALPINYYFNYCPPCRCDSYNATYFQNCIHYTNRKVEQQRQNQE